MDKKNNEVEKKNLDLDAIMNGMNEFLSKIPEDVLKLITERAYKDAKIFLMGNNEKNVQKLTYTIYRTYLLGMFFENKGLLKAVQEYNN